MSTVSLQKDFSETLRAMLAEKKMSQAELARKSGVAIPTISKILCGKMSPSFATCEKLIGALSEEFEMALSISKKKTA
jgi:transcriptional regulator with XRE-family HTH domain